jgi:hypothetical protein
MKKGYKAFNGNWTCNGYVFDEETIERFLGKVKKISKSGCWNWSGRRDKYGYGRFDITKPYIGNIGAHRFFHFVPGELAVAHHRCRNKSCVNPNHIVLVSKTGHTELTGNNITTINAKKIACPYGHLYSTENTLHTKSGKRVCLSCKRQRDKKYKAIKKKEAWSGMPREAIEYLKSLPEWDAKVFNEVTGMDEK